MKCWYCGSEDVVWDYRTGSVVCRNCGLVLDMIFDASTGFVEDEVAVLRRMSPARAMTANHLGSDLRSIEHRVKKYEKFARHARRGVVVDVTALNPGSRIRVYRGSVDEVLKPLEESLREFLEVIEEDPLLGSRTYRGKIAAAFILREVVTKGVTPNVSTVVKTCLVSQAQARRIIKLVERRLPRLYQAIMRKRLAGRLATESSLLGSPGN